MKECIDQALSQFSGKRNALMLNSLNQLRIPSATVGEQQHTNPKRLQIGYGILSASADLKQRRKTESSRLNMARPFIFLLLQTVASGCSTPVLPLCA